MSSLELAAATSNEPQQHALVNAPLATGRVPCRQWRRTGKCPFGQRCHFGHDMAQQAAAVVLRKDQAGQ